MRFRARLLALGSALTLLATATAALGAETSTTRQAPPGLLWFIILGPLVLVFSLVAVFVWRSYVRRHRLDLANAHLHRDVQTAHMANLERQGQRMIELLESIDRKLGDRHGPTDSIH